MTDPKPNVILVADRTLSGEYKILFEGIFATMQSTHVPELFMRYFVSPKVKTDSNHRAQKAPLGLRRVESALINLTGLTPENVICTTPEDLPKLLGPHIDIVAFSSSDPLGMGMSNTTTKNFWPGQLYTKHWTSQTLKILHDAKQKYHFKVIAGGAGAWQFKQYPDPLAHSTLDLIFDGYFENAGSQLVTDIINQKTVPNYYREPDSCVSRVQPITAPTVLGIVEISRGCGKGCKFCTMAHQKMQHLEPELICHDIETNTAADQNTIVLASEDFFRYGSPTGQPDPKPIFALLKKIQKIKNLRFLQLDHANIATVAQLKLDDLKQIRRLLTFQHNPRYLWVNMGIESANGQLVALNCPGKTTPYPPDQWDNIVRQTAEKMNHAGFFPVFSIILGLPGETPNDLEKTSRLIDHLDRTAAVIFPIFYEPIDPQQIAAGQNFTITKMTQQHLALYQKCYEINFRRVPKLFWDNQTAAGEKFLKKLFVQALGKIEVATWRSSFRKLRKNLPGQTR